MNYLYRFLMGIGFIISFCVLANSTVLAYGNLACVYTGSFDPLHRGHREVIGIAYRESQCTKVYVVAKRGFFSEKPNRRSWEIRHSMLKLALGKIPYVELPQEDYPELVKQLKAKNEKVIGVIGSDRALSPSEDHLKLEVDEWFIVTRNQHAQIKDLLSLKFVLGKSAKIFVAIDHVYSSTQVRNQMKAGLRLEQTAILPELIDFIESNNIYK